jgi:ankyrin repeat protein
MSQTGANMQPHPVTLDSRTHKGRDVLFIAALAGQAEIVAMLLDLDMGDMKDMVDRDGRSALHAAAMGGDPDCASLLIDAGWPVDATDFIDYTPLFVAAECGNTLVLKLLVDAGESTSSCDLDVILLNVIFIYKLAPPMTT